MRETYTFRRTEGHLLDFERGGDGGFKHSIVAAADPARRERLLIQHAAHGRGNIRGRSGIGPAGCTFIPVRQ
jgi:hypothetical protein